MYHCASRKIKQENRHHLLSSLTIYLDRNDAKLSNIVSYVIPEPQETTRAMDLNLRLLYCPLSNPKTSNIT